MSSDFELLINATKYKGWTKLQITRSMEQLAHSFMMDSVVPASGRVGYAGNLCEVQYKGGIVTTGFLDEDTLDYDANSKTFGVSGRSTTGDLVDCSAIYKGGQWKNTGLLKIAQDLCDPFEINVTAYTDLGTPFKYFKIEPGEKVFDCLDRAARMRGVFLSTTSDGHLAIETVGQERITTPLEYGKNIKKCQYKRSFADRFGSYKVIAQLSMGGNIGNMMTPKQITISKTSTDSQSRHRPLIIQAETEDSASELQKRADWERNTRAGRSLRVTYTVQGWEHAKGLWEPNRLVAVNDPTIPLIDDELLIVSVTYTRGEEGTLTSLELTQPEAFTVKPLPPKKVKKGAIDNVQP